MTYQEAIEFLYGLRWFGAKFGLANTFKLAELAGSPQNRLRFIHVAGTNGKGSTCAMLESIYRASGLRVGLFTSPHLVSFSERIQVNRHRIPKPEVVRLVQELLPAINSFPSDEHPTFFEVVTVMALRFFEIEKCDLVIWETGLGGRLDATNIVTPLASVITNIDYDHQKWLGETLSSIAAEKAGIIKPGVPVITAADHPEAFNVIARTAAERGATLTQVRSTDANQPPLDHLALPLLGEHQRLNAAVALATVRVLAPQLPVAAEAIERGLARVRWAGRMQLITRPNGQKILIDGAHNPGGAKTLAAALETHFPGQRPALLLGILRDKDWPEMCRILAPFSREILLVPVHSDRTATTQELAAQCRALNPAATVVECASVAEALARAKSEPFILAAGSLYLAGEVLEVLDAHSSGASERALNEWSPTRPGPQSASG